MTTGQMELPQRKLPSDPELSCKSEELEDSWTIWSGSGREELGFSLEEGKLWTELYPASDPGI